MNTFSFYSFITSGGIFPILYFIFSIIALVVFIYEKKRRLLSNRIISLRHLFIFFISFSVVLTVNSLIVVRQYNLCHTSCFWDMLVSKSFLITTALFVILMQEIDFISRNSKLFPILICFYILVIGIADLFFIKVSSSMTSYVFRIAVVVINLFSYFIMVVKAVKRNRNSKLFNSKSRVVEIIINSTILVVVNYQYAVYLLAEDKSLIMYCLISFWTILNVVVTHRVIHGEPELISRLDREVMPYPIIPALSEEIVDYGKGADMKTRLCLFFENEKPYLSPDLSISTVAERLFTNKSYLSKILNVNMQKNFNEFVNHYRVREAMKIYVDNNDLSINDLCRMCGFRNVASFTTAFRLHAGKTPGDWCRTIKNRGEDDKHKKYLRKEA